MIVLAFSPMLVGAAETTQGAFPSMLSGGELTGVTLAMTLALYWLRAETSSRVTAVMQHKEEIERVYKERLAAAERYATSLDAIAQRLLAARGIE